MHGLVPENLHGKAYARTTATALNKRQQNVKPGQNVSPRDTFTSNNRKEFSPVNFRRCLEQPDNRSVKDYEDYARSLNEEMYESKTKVIQKANPAMASTICSRTSTGFFNNRQTARQQRLSMTGQNFNPNEAELKPKLLESRVINQKEFFNLSTGFQKVFANDEKDKNMAIPIAGYSGHQRGDKAQNYFGRSFRDSAIQSKRLERSLNR